MDQVSMYGQGFSAPPATLLMAVSTEITRNCCFVIPVVGQKATNHGVGLIFCWHFG